MPSSWPPAPIGSRERATLAEASKEAARGGRHAPERQCLVTRAHGLRQSMLRFVASPADDVVFDVAATLPGRGMWLSPRRDVIESAVKRGLFSKAARRRLGVPDRLADVVTAALTERIAALVGLARRAGDAVGGFDKAADWLGRGRCGLLVEALDGSAAEQARLLGRRVVPVVSPLTAAQLGAVFGRERLVHVAVAPGRLAAMIACDTERLVGVAGAEVGRTAGDRPVPEERGPGREMD